MHAKRKALLAAGLFAGAAALTGCTASTMPVTTPTPKAAQQQTAQPATAEPAASPTADAPGETTEDAEQGEASSLTLEVGGRETDVNAISEQGELFLPLMATGEALGWKANSEETQEETRTKRTITLEKDDSRITVAWTVSDNTVESITWQKDGLLIPVDTRLTTLDGVVYVPAAFFEEAADVRIARTQTKVMLSTPEPIDTPQTMEESSGENG